MPLLSDAEPQPAKRRGLPRWVALLTLVVGLAGLLLASQGEFELRPAFRGYSVIVKAGGPGNSSPVYHLFLPQAPRGYDSQNIDGFRIATLRVGNRAYLFAFGPTPEPDSDVARALTGGT